MNTPIASQCSGKWHVADRGLGNDPPRVLLQEEDEELRRSVAAVLREAGYEVVEAEDAQAIRCVYDLVVSNVRVAARGGFRIVEELRKRQWTPPVIVMIGACDDATRRRAEALGAVLLDQRFGVDDLRTAVLDLVPHSAHPTQRYGYGGPPDPDCAPDTERMPM